MVDPKGRLLFTGPGKDPTYANASAAGLDLSIRTEEAIVFHPGDHYRIHTGLCFEIPPGFFGLVAIRSSLGARGLVLANGIGIIDEDYRGELQMPLYNHGRETIILEDGERVGQMVLLPYIQLSPLRVEALSESERGTEGFGSSGRF